MWRVVLILGLPLALMAVMTLPSEYPLMGTAALDCDSPFSTYMFGLPAICLYGGGALMLIRSPRKPSDLLWALLCVAIIAPILINLIEARRFEVAQAQACKSN